MNKYSSLISDFSHNWRKLLLCLLFAILFTSFITASANRSIDDNEDNLGSGYVYIPETSSPIAEDDNGPGFVTDEDHAFTTGNVLTNDFDADGDLLFVSEIDLSNTIGSVHQSGEYLDPSFGIGGRVITNISDTDRATGLLVQPDKKIILVGYVWNDPVSYDFAVLRYNIDGSLDTGFGDNGITLTDFGWTDIAYAVAYQPDDRIIVAGFGAGSENQSINLARYNPDGSLDDSFGEDGKVVTTDINVQDLGFMGLALQADGKIVVAATSAEPDPVGYTILVVRFTADGSLDTTFDGDGIVTIDIGVFGAGYDVVIQSDNKILVSGEGIDYSGDRRGIVVARINTDGSMDEGFGVDGIVLTDFGFNDSPMGMSMVLQSDDKILVLGNTDDSFVLVRYNTEGSLDTSFDEDGIIQSDLLESADIAIEPNGKIDVIGSKSMDILGTSGTASDNDMAVVRYDPDGNLDSNFGNAGIFSIGFDDANGKTITLSSNGLLYVAGDAGDDFGLAQITISGTFTYDPDHRFDYLQSGQYANDTFTYTVNDGVLTATATVTITINGLPEYNYLPLACNGWQIYGVVSENGVLAPGIPLDLRFYNGTSWSTIASTTTDVNGNYSFNNLPGLRPGQEYYVLYLNSSDPDRLWVWGTRSLTYADGNSSVNLGNFDISNIELTSPDPGAEIPLPYLFQWKARLESLQDSYEFDLYDPRDGDPYFYTDPLGYVDRYYLIGYPSGFVKNYYYAWDIWAYSPDEGYGISFYSYYVVFVDQNMMYLLERQPIHRETMQDLETWTRR